jgi:polysaccharide export outer membrane protein
MRPLAPAAILTVCALSLAGCGDSLDSSGIQSGLAPGDQKAGAGAASGADANASPQHLAKAANAFAAAGTPGSAAYKIGPQDVLEISVFKVPDLSRSVQVADVGTINLPLVGEVTAAGRTARDLERELAKKLGAKYLQSPQVTVYVKEFNSRRVTIDGAVKKPGVYPIRAKTTLVQFMAMAEGATDIADTSSVAVFRTVEGKRSVARFDLNEIRSGTAQDPVIQEGDVIVVSESATKTAFQNFLKAFPITSVFVPLL